MGEVYRFDEGINIMAAISFSLASFPDCERVTLSATPNNLQEVTIKSGTKTVSVNFVGYAGKIAFTGTDAAAIGADYITVPANQIVELAIDPSCTAIFLASATASVVAEIVIENR